VGVPGGLPPQANNIAKWDGSVWAPLVPGCAAPLTALGWMAAKSLCWVKMFPTSRTEFPLNTSPSGTAALGALSVSGMNGFPLHFRELPLLRNGNGNLYSGGMASPPRGDSGRSIASGRAVPCIALGAGMNTNVPSDGGRISQGSIYAVWAFYYGGRYFCHYIAIERWRGEAPIAPDDGPVNALTALDGVAIFTLGHVPPMAGGIAANRIAPPPPQWTQHCSASGRGSSGDQDAGTNSVV